MAYGNLPGGGFSGFLKSEEPLVVKKRSYIPIKDDWPPKYGLYGEEISRSNELLLEDAVIPKSKEVILIDVEDKGKRKLSKFQLKRKQPKEIDDEQLELEPDDAVTFQSSKDPKKSPNVDVEKTKQVSKKVSFDEEHLQKYYDITPPEVDYHDREVDYGRRVKLKSDDEHLSTFGVSSKEKIGTAKLKGFEEITEDKYRDEHTETSIPKKRSIRSIKDKVQREKETLDDKYFKDDTIWDRGKPQKLKDGKVKEAKTSEHLKDDSFKILTKEDDAKDKRFKLRQFSKHEKSLEDGFKGIFGERAEEKIPKSITKYDTFPPEGDSKVTMKEKAEAEKEYREYDQDDSQLSVKEKVKRKAKEKKTPKKMAKYGMHPKDDADITTKKVTEAEKFTQKKFSEHEEYPDDLPFLSRELMEEKIDRWKRAQYDKYPVDDSELPPKKKDEIEKAKQKKITPPEQYPDEVSEFLTMPKDEEKTIPKKRVKYDKYSEDDSKISMSKGIDAEKVKPSKLAKHEQYLQNDMEFLPKIRAKETIVPRKISRYDKNPVDDSKITMKKKEDVEKVKQEKHEQYPEEVSQFFPKLKEEEKRGLKKITKYDKYSKDDFKIATKKKTKAEIHEQEKFTKRKQYPGEDLKRTSRERTEEKEAPQKIAKYKKYTVDDSKIVIKEKDETGKIQQEKIAKHKQYPDDISEFLPKAKTEEKAVPKEKAEYYKYPADDSKIVRKKMVEAKKAKPEKFTKHEHHLDDELEFPSKEKSEAKVIPEKQVKYRKYVKDESKITTKEKIEAEIGKQEKITEHKEYSEDDLKLLPIEKSEEKAIPQRKTKYEKYLVDDSKIAAKKKDVGEQVKPKKLSRYEQSPGVDSEFLPKPKAKEKAVSKDKVDYSKTVKRKRVEADKAKLETFTKQGQYLDDDLEFLSKKSTEAKIVPRKIVKYDKFPEDDSTITTKKKVEAEIGEPETFTKYKHDPEDDLALPSTEKKKEKIVPQKTAKYDRYPVDDSKITTKKIDEAEKVKQEELVEHEQYPKDASKFFPESKAEEKVIPRKIAKYEKYPKDDSKYFPGSKAEEKVIPKKIAKYETYPKEDSKFFPESKAEEKVIPKKIAKYEKYPKDDSKFFPESKAEEKVIPKKISKYEKYPKDDSKFFPESKAEEKVIPKKVAKYEKYAKDDLKISTKEKTKKEKAKLAKFPEHEQYLEDDMEFLSRESTKKKSVPKVDKYDKLQKDDSNITTKMTEEEKVKKQKITKSGQDFKDDSNYPTEKRFEKEKELLSKEISRDDVYPEDLFKPVAIKEKVEVKKDKHEKMTAIDKFPEDKSVITSKGKTQKIKREQAKEGEYMKDDSFKISVKKDAEDNKIQEKVTKRKKDLKDYSKITSKRKKEEISTQEMSRDREYPADDLKKRKEKEEISKYEKLPTVVDEFLPKKTEEKNIITEEITKEETYPKAYSKIKTKKEEVAHEKGIPDQDYPKDYSQTTPKREKEAFGIAKEKEIVASKQPEDYSKIFIKKEKTERTDREERLSKGIEYFKDLSEISTKQKKAELKKSKREKGTLSDEKYPEYDTEAKKVKSEKGKQKFLGDDPDIPTKKDRAKKEIIPEKVIKDQGYLESETKIATKERFGERKDKKKTLTSDEQYSTAIPKKEKREKQIFQEKKTRDFKYLEEDSKAATREQQVEAMKDEHEKRTTGGEYPIKVLSKKKSIINEIAEEKPIADAKYTEDFPKPTAKRTRRKKYEKERLTKEKKDVKDDSKTALKKKQRKEGGEFKDKFFVDDKYEIDPSKTVTTEEKDETAEVQKYEMPVASGDEHAKDDLIIPKKEDVNLRGVLDKTSGFKKQLDDEVIFFREDEDGLPEMPEILTEDEREIYVKFRRERKVLTYTYYKRKRSILRFCPCLDRLLHSKRVEYRGLKAMLGFPIGALFGFGLYWLVLNRIGAPHYYCWLLGISVGIGFALSTQIRCICFLSIPACCGRSGRAFVSTYVISHIIEGPFNNTLTNAKEAMRSISCTAALNLNHTVERFQLMFKPVKEIVMDFIGAGEKVQKDTKQLEKTFTDIENEVRDENEVRESMADVEELDDEIGQESRSDIIKRKFKQRRKPSFGEESEKKYGMKSEFRCEGIFTKGVRGCYKSFEKAYDRCHSYLPIIGYLLCWPMKLTFICDLASSMMGKRTCDSDIVVNPGFGASVDTADGVQAEFDKDFAVQLQYKLKIPEERVDQLVPEDIAGEIKYSFERRKKNLDFFTNLVNRILVLLCLLVLNASRKYCNKYLRIIQFDNKYVTSYFRHIDARRRKVGKVILLPLKKGEKLELFNPFSVKFSAEEKMMLLVSGIKLISEVVTVTILLLFDRIFFELLDVIKRNTHVTYKQTGVHHIKMTIYGDGFVGNMVRGILKGFDKKYSADQVTTTEECLPLPIKLPNSMITRLYFVFLLLLVLIILESYALRLRRVICSFFYPKREKKRIIFLYNDRLKKRRSFLQHMKHRVRKQAREQAIAIDSGVFYSLRHFYPKYFNWVTKLGLGLSKCLICSESESKRYRLIACSECPFSYCPECWQDTEGKCYACLPDYDTEPSGDSVNEEEYD